MYSIWWTFAYYLVIVNHLKLLCEIYGPDVSFITFISNLNLIWIWSESDLNLIWIWSESDLNLIWINNQQSINANVVNVTKGESSSLPNHVWKHIVFHCPLMLLADRSTRIWFLRKAYFYLFVCSFHYAIMFIVAFSSGICRYYYFFVWYICYSICYFI